MPTITSVTVTPVNPFILINETQQFTAIAHFSDAADLDVTNDISTTWSSATTSVATINSSGLATALTISGSTVISATYNSQIGTSVLKVGLANYSRIFEQVVQANVDRDPVTKLTSSNLSMFTGGVVFLNNNNAAANLGWTILSSHPDELTKAYIANEQQQIGNWLQLKANGNATIDFSVPNQKNLGVASSTSVDENGNQLVAGGNPILIQTAGEAYVSTTDGTIVLGSFLGPDVSGKIKKIPFDPMNPTPILGYALENFAQTFSNMVLMRIQICGE